MKKKVFAVVMVSFMVMSFTMGTLKAADEPFISNPSFEQEIDENENQMYKAERTTEEAYDGDYSIKVGTLKPEDESKVSLWSNTQGKGSVNVVIHNVKPNTQYKVTTHYKRASAVKMSTGVLDIDGQNSSSSWKLASSIKTVNSGTAYGEWETHEHTITTGPRTTEIYAFAYTEYTGNEDGSGLFYVDDFEIEEVKTNTATNTASIGYQALDSYEFPATIPAIQNFEKEYGTFNLNTENQEFYTDAFSQAKTQRLADSMKDKGIIEAYNIQTITNVAEAGEGIVVVKQPIQFDLPNTVKGSVVDAYQIDITENKIVIYSDYIEGVQNGTMTLLQALSQRKVLPTGTVEDYTDQVVRGLQVDSGRRYYSIEWLKDEVEQMAYYKQNVLQLRLKDNEGIRYESDVASFMLDDDRYWTQEEVTELVEYAKQFNIEVIPEIDYPGHANQDAGYEGNADWRLDNSKKALDFSKEEVREYIISVYKEAIDFFDAKTIHIGGDEFFEGGCTPAGRAILASWAKEETGNSDANEYDAMKLLFNQVYDELIAEYPDIKILVWNDNIRDLGGIVPLNKNIVVDFWAGGMYGSISAQNTANSGYQIMSSSSSNYHDLWPQQNQMKLDRPLPESMYNEFTRYNYSRASTYYYQDEVLKENLDKSLGQVFPIWDDAHGYVPEYILSRTLFPRYGGFAYKTWGADYTNEMNYDEFENLLFLVGTPTADLFPQVSINYTRADLDLVISEIETALIPRVDTVNENIEILETLIDTVTSTPKDYEVDGFYNDIVKELISLYENIDYAIEAEDIADKTELLEAIQSIDDVDTSIYETEDILGLMEVKKEAETMMANKQASQEEVDAMIDLIAETIADLELKSANYTAVDKAITNAEEYLDRPDDYEGIDALQDAIDAVQRDLDYTHQGEVDAMANAIQDAIDDLVFIGDADKSELLEWIGECEWELENEAFLFKDEAIAKLEAYIEEGNLMMADTNATSEEVQALTEEIRDFIYELWDGEWEKDPDLSAFDAAVKKAEALNPDDYVDFSDVEYALYDAEDLNDDRDSLSMWDQEYIDEVTQAIEDAIAALEYKLADYLTVDTALAKVEALNPEEYIDFSKVEEAVNAVVRDLKPSEQDKVYAMAEAIEDAIAALEYKLADYTAMDAILAKVATLNPEDYVDFSKVNEAVSTVVRDLKITEQDRVDAMVAAIEEAIGALENKAVDKDLINELITEAESLNSADYTSDSWESFTNILNEVKGIVGNEEATAEEIEAAYLSLQDAINSLVKVVPIESTDPEPTIPEEEGVNEQNNIETGDITNTSLFLTLLGGAMLSIVILTKKRRVNK